MTDDTTDSRLFGRYIKRLSEYIKTGRYALIDTIPDFYNFRREHAITSYRKRFKLRDYPKFDIIAITTLFTFYWKETIDTINAARDFLAPSGRLLVGGVAASLVPDEIFKETDIIPITGLLDTPGRIDPDNPDIIDDLPLDYSILNETDYTYPASDAYFAYTTRGCIRKCAFCAVPLLEPHYRDFTGIYEQVRYIDEHFGARKDLLLMDNNVLASGRLREIVDEIKRCGFAKGASYIPPNEYAIAIENLKHGYNTRAYIRKIILLYEKTASKMSEREAGEFYIYREKHNLLTPESASPEEILETDEYFSPIYAKYFRPVKRSRYVDFNQGIDARLINDENMKMLAEINIRPLRIAFDHVEDKDVYIRAVRTAARYGIDDLSNYLLYNFEDKPDDLYERMNINVELCEELDVKIYSFPMKYHPVRDPEYFRNRDYIGRHWNRKFIRAIQAVMKATMGKIGRGQSFFHAAFGHNTDEFHDILYMPEAFIIYRNKYKYTLAAEWHDKFHALNDEAMQIAKAIIEANDFTHEDEHRALGQDIWEVLSYYYRERE